MEPKVQTYEANERKAGTDPALARDIPEGFPEVSEYCLSLAEYFERKRYGEQKVSERREELISSDIKRVFEIYSEPCYY